MLRRCKDSFLNGKVLIDLPPRVVNIVTCEFDPEEMEFYRALSEKVDVTLSKYIKSGEMMRNYTSVMVLFDYTSSEVLIFRNNNLSSEQEKAIRLRPFGRAYRTGGRGSCSGKELFGCRNDWLL